MRYVFRSFAHFKNWVVHFPNHAIILIPFSKSLRIRLTVRILSPSFNNCDFVKVK